MPSPRIVVFGGTGKTGAAISEELARRGAVPVRLSRGSWDDLPEVLAGADAGYLIAPNMHPDEPAYVEAALDALRDAGVDRVVYHSVASPYAPSMPHHVGKARSEDLVRRSGLAWTILQPGAYLQNLSVSGPWRIAYRADRIFGFADLAEVAVAAATVLLDSRHVGACYELASVQASVADLAEQRGIAVEVISPQAWAESEGAALEPRVREWLLAMFDYYEQHGLPVGTLPLSTLLAGNL